MPGTERSRLPALYYLKQREKLQTDFGFFIHDANRAGEISVLFDWAKELNRNYTTFTKTLSGFIVGNQFDINIL
jgi:hypothetical protein